MTSELLSHRGHERGPADEGDQAEAAGEVGIVDPAGEGGRGGETEKGPR